MFVFFAACLFQNKINVYKEEAISERFLEAEVSLGGNKEVTPHSEIINYFKVHKQVYCAVGLHTMHGNYINIALRSSVNT